MVRLMGYLYSFYLLLQSTTRNSSWQYIFKFLDGNQQTNNQHYIASVSKLQVEHISSLEKKCKFYNVSSSKILNIYLVARVEMRNFMEQQKKIDTYTKKNKEDSRHQCEKGSGCKQRTMFSFLNRIWYVHLGSLVFLPERFGNVVWWPLVAK